MSTKYITNVIPEALSQSDVIGLMEGLMQRQTENLSGFDEESHKLQDSSSLRSSE